MYDKLFSKQWIFDRCLEGSSFQQVIIGLLTILIVILFFFLFKKCGFSKPKMVLSLLGVGIFAFLVSIFIDIVTGFFILGCSDSMFWKGVMEANKLYSQVKYECKKNNCPKSEKELRNLNQFLYDQMASNAKSKYSYTSYDKKYTWYVRPSKYYLVSFGGNGFEVFKIPEPLGIRHWDVPEFKGSISDLPN